MPLVSIPALSELYRAVGKKRPLLKEIHLAVVTELEASYQLDGVYGIGRELIRDTGTTYRPLNVPWYEICCKIDAETPFKSLVGVKDRGSAKVFKKRVAYYTRSLHYVCFFSRD